MDGIDNCFEYAMWIMSKISIRFVKIRSNLNKLLKLLFDSKLFLQKLIFSSESKLKTI